MKSAPQHKRSAKYAVRVAAAFTVAAVLGFSVACSSDGIAAPEMKANNNAVSDLLNGVGGVVNGVVGALIPSRPLTRNVALTNAVVRSATIGRNGGTIEMKDLGLKMTFPSGAITGNAITVTVTAVPGRAVAYEFEPHGTQFAKPVQFEQSLDNTSWDHQKLEGVLNGGYFKSLNQLNLGGGLALLDELFPVLVKSNRVSFDIRHFSGYMVSTGRSDSDSDAF